MVEQKYFLRPGITKVGSAYDAAIRIPSLPSCHCELLHIPERVNLDGSVSHARVSILVGNRARATINGRPVLRYDQLTDGCTLDVGPGGSPILFMFHNPMSMDDDENA